MTQQVVLRFEDWTNGNILVFFTKGQSLGRTRGHWQSVIRGEAGDQREDRHDGDVLGLQTDSGAPL